jgi:hypothetical protein
MDIIFNFNQTNNDALPLAYTLFTILFITSTTTKYHLHNE